MRFLSYKYFFNNESTTVSSWFAGAGFQRSNIEDDGVFSKSTTSLLGGYQWAFRDRWAFELETSYLTSNIGGDEVSVLVAILNL